MTAAEILAECNALDVVLQRNGNRLDIDAPQGTLTSDLLARLREHKDELLALLRLLPDTPIDLAPTRPACRCGATAWKDTPIHGGRSVRRDCVGCGRFIAFPVWHGEPTASQKQTS